MARKKAAAHCKILPWLSAKGDNHEGRFLQVGNSLLLSKEFQKLKLATQHCYLCMALESGGQKTFRFPLSSAKKYNISSSTLRRCTEELEKKGFIKIQSNANIRKPNVYTFCIDWKTRPP